MIDGSDLQLFRYIEHQVYLLALLGLATFYGLERMIKCTGLASRPARRHAPACSGCISARLRSTTA